MADARDLRELDALRGVAIVAVSGLHVSFTFLLAAPTGSTAATAALTIHVLTAFATPLFVALSMAGLTLGYERPVGFGADYRTFLARRAARVLPAYVFWTILTMLRNDPAIFGRPGAVAHQLVSGTAGYHLYFVPLICLYYVLWPLLSRLATGARRGRIAAVAIAGAGIAAMLAVWRAASAGIITNGILALPLFWIGYATLGLATAPAVAHRLRKREVRWPTIPLAALTAVTALGLVRHVRAIIGPTPDRTTLTIGVTIFQTPTLVYTLAAMALAVALVGGPRRGTATLQALGRYSYGVYLAHVLVLEVIVRRVFGHPENADFSTWTWLVALLAEWAACLVVTFGLVRTMAAAPGLAVFAGVRASDRDVTSEALAQLTPPPRAP